MEVFRMQNPQALMVPQVQKFFQDAMMSVDFAAPGGFNTIAMDLIKYITDPHFFVIVGAEAGEFKTLSMGFFPADNIYPYPTISLFYNKGSKALLRAVARQTVDTILQAGYTSAWAVNSTGKPDAAWMRLFGLPGETEVIPLGRVMEIKVV